MPLKAFACPQNSKARCWTPCSGRGQKARSLPRAQRSDLGQPLRVHRPPRNRASMPEGSGFSVASKHSADHEKQAPTHRDSSSDASSRLIVPNRAERARTPSSPRSSAASPQKASSWLFLATSRFGDTGTDGQCSPDRIIAQCPQRELALLSRRESVQWSLPASPNGTSPTGLHPGNEDSPGGDSSATPKGTSTQRACGLVVAIGTRTGDSSWICGPVGSTAK